MRMRMTMCTPLDDLHDTHTTPCTCLPFAAPGLRPWPYLLYSVHPHTFTTCLPAFLLAMRCYAPVATAFPR